MVIWEAAAGLGRTEKPPFIVRAQCGAGPGSSLVDTILIMERGWGTGTGSDLPDVGRY